MTGQSDQFPPMGGEGSGMARYAAAMTLYRQRLIGAETLEVFRICAPDNARDPLAALRRLGLTADIAALTSRFPEETAR